MADNDKRFPLTLTRIQAIASNTFKEAVRARAFIGMMVLALVFIMFSLVLSALALSDQGPRVLVNFGFFAISLFGVLIAIVMGVILVYKEIEKKTIYTIIPKPVHRFEVILGKYVGMLYILLVEVSLLSLVWLALLWLKGIPVSMEVLKTLALIFMEIMLITSVALLFSAFSSPILSGVFTAGIFVVGRVTYIISEMLGARTGLFANNPELKPIGEAVVAVFPDLQVFNTSREVLLGIPIEWGYVLGAFGYSLAFIAVFLTLAVLLFQRRDFV